MGRRVCREPRANFNPHSPCGERPGVAALGRVLRYFNPRSPCGERLLEVLDEHMECGFQSTLPVWGATSQLIAAILPLLEFQSTLPVWGATCGTIVTGIKARLFQSTLPVWGATPSTSTSAKPQAISIHAPRVGSDSKMGFYIAIHSISIHAPRVGSDELEAFTPEAITYFNPRSPCGERPKRPEQC